MKKPHEQYQSVRATRKIGMDEMASIVGALTTEYSPSPAEMAHQQEQLRAARASLDAYYIGRLTGAIAVEFEPQTSAEVEEAMHYKELLDRHTLAMIELHSADADGADVLTHPAFGEGDQTPFDQLAS